MATHLSLEGKPRKLLGLLPRTAGAGTLEKIRNWIAQRADGVVLAQWIEQSDLGPSLYAVFHPAALPVQFHLGRNLLVHATTSSVGPGYHVWLVDLLNEMGRDLGYTWTGTDDADYFDSGNPDHPRREMLSWLSKVAQSVLEMRANEITGLAVSLPSEPIFRYEADVLTPLGPRTFDWCEQVARDAEKGREFFPWWNAEPDGDFLFNRALCEMWTNVRWDKPVVQSEYERGLRVISDLEAAYRDGKDRPYPWKEWAELIRHTGAEEHFPHVLENASRQPDRPLIGYRRADVVCHPFGLWSIQLPGSLLTDMEDESSWRAYDWTRTVRFSSVTMKGPDLRTQDLEKLRPKEEGERLDWDHEECLGRAVIFKSTEDDRPVEMIRATVVARSSFCVVSVSYESLADRDWAVSVVRSVKPFEQPVMQQR